MLNYNSSNLNLAFDVLNTADFSSKTNMCSTYVNIFLFIALVIKLLFETIVFHICHDVLNIAVFNLIIDREW